MLFNLRKKIKIHFALIVVLVFALANCIQDKDVPDIGKTAISLRLADGSPLSSPNADDYNPVALPLPSGKIALVFGSNRGGQHELWITQTVNPYDGLGEFPPFDAPKVIKPNTGSNIAFSERIPFAAYMDFLNNAVVIFYTNKAASDAIYKLTIPESSISSGTATQENTNETGLIVGSALNDMQNPVQLSLFIVKTNKLYTLPISSGGSPSEIFLQAPISSTSWITGMPDSFGLNQAGLISVQDGPPEAPTVLFTIDNGIMIGPVDGLNIPLGDQGLGISYHSIVMSPFGSSFLFSAGPDYNGNQDMYVVTSHDVFELWNMGFREPGGIFGGPGITGFGITPSDIPGLQAWFAADMLFGFNDGDPISVWPDNYDEFNPYLLQAPSGNEPGFFFDPNLNFPGLMFSSSSSTYMTSIDIYTVGHVFMVANNTVSDTFSAASTLLSVNNAGTWQDEITGAGAGSTLSSAGSLSNVKVYTGNATTPGEFAPIDLYKIISASSATPIQSNGIAIGASYTGSIASNFWTGGIAELLIYDHELSPQEEQDVVQYFKDKYRIPDFLPNSLSTPTLSLWLRADARVETAASQWFCSIPGPCTINSGWYHLLNATPAGQLTPANSGPTANPLYNPGVINGQPAVTFGIQSDFQTAADNYFTSTIAAPATTTLFLVFQPEFTPSSPMTIFDADSATGGYRIEYTSSDQIQFVFNGTAITLAPVLQQFAPVILTATINSTTLDASINGIAEPQVTGISFSTPSSIALGCDYPGTGTSCTAGTYFVGSIGEVIVYNGALNATDIQKVECYLSQRYSIPLAQPCP